MDTKEQREQVLDIAALERENPNVDAATVVGALRLVRDLRQAGVRQQGYRLANPHTRTYRWVNDAGWSNASVRGRDPLK